MTVICPNAKNKVDANTQRSLIMDCLKETRCPMTPDQIREWLRDRRLGTLTAAQLLTQLRILQKDGKVQHPAISQTCAWTYVPGAR